MWVLTVPSPRNSAAAISAFVLPCPMSARTSRSRPLSVSRPASLAGACGVADRYTRSTRPVTAGSSQAPPSATTRTARCKSSAVTPLRMKPDAPARSIAARTSSSSNVVRARTGGPAPRRRSSLVAWTPSTDGMRTSISTTSGCSASTVSATRLPSGSSPAISNPNCDRRMPRSPVRTSSWSSTRSTRIMPPPPPAECWPAATRRRPASRCRQARPGRFRQSTRPVPAC